LYALWIKVDETLPLIELKDEYPTRKVAKKAAQKIPGNIKVRVVKVLEDRKQINALVATESIG
jgi:hypothetical protein